MNAPLPRRSFLRRTSLTTAGVLAARAFPALHAEGANGRVRVATMGLHRGEAHLHGFMSWENVEVVYVCDVDRRTAESAATMVEKKQGRRPQVVSDFRRVLDDKSVDALSIAAPNHWHAIAAISACEAGKHVYVEKPGSHNAREAELLVTAARHYQRVVQMGNQRRSWPFVREAIDRLRAGAIGKVRYARSWYAADRGSIGRGKNVPVPEWLDFTLWQGPAPDRPYVDNLVHYNWHWRWHWGGGELANNGPHALDLVRWGLGVEHPHRVSCSGGRYHFDDDQETPDTTLVTYDFGHCAAAWEGLSCESRGSYGTGFGVEFQGEGGSMVLLDSGVKTYDAKDKLVSESPGKGDDRAHFGNFIEGIRGNAKLNSEIAEGQLSTRLCHLGNIAWRSGHTLSLEPKTGRIIDDPAATKFWGREEYRRGWEPKVPGA